MPIVLGAASSHAPSMFCKADDWPRVHAGLTRGLPQPPELAAETPEVIADYVARIGAGFGTLRQRIEAARPDAVVIIGDDQTEVFAKSLNPVFAVYLGESASGTTSISWIGENRADNHVSFGCNTEVARTLLVGLMERGFDPATMEELKPMARPEGGLGHAFTRIARVMGLPESGIPAVLLFVNSYHPPLPSAERCFRLGQAIAETFAGRPERVVLYGSGGLSHCPVGPRAGWVDEPLDHWVLDRIARGEGEKLTNLFTFDSDTLRSGTGEIRSWIVVAGAMAGTGATVVDYLPARHAVTGLGFAYWDPDTQGQHPARPTR